MQSESASDIRAAIASGEYEQALRLWNGYTAQVRERLGDGSLSEAAFAELRELAEWSRTILLCSRAHMLDHLNSRYVAGIYASRRGAPPEGQPETR